MHKIFCVECNQNVNATKVSGINIYKNRFDLIDKVFYKCPHCGNYVGTHPGTDKPLGCIPNKKLRRKRIDVHDAMDMLWKNKLISRKQLYKELSDRLGYNYHNGTTTSLEQCNDALKIIEEIRRIRVGN